MAVQINAYFIKKSPCCENYRTVVVETAPIPILLHSSGLPRLHYDIIFTHIAKNAKNACLIFAFFIYSGTSQIVLMM